MGNFEHSGSFEEFEGPDNDGKLPYEVTRNFQNKIALLTANPTMSVSEKSTSIFEINGASFGITTAVAVGGVKSSVATIFDSFKDEIINELNFPRTGYLKGKTLLFVHKFNEDIDKYSAYLFQPASVLQWKNISLANCINSVPEYKDHMESHSAAGLQAMYEHGAKAGFLDALDRLGNENKELESSLMAVFNQLELSINAQLFLYDPSPQGEDRPAVDKEAQAKVIKQLAKEVVQTSVYAHNNRSDHQVLRPLLYSGEFPEVMKQIAKNFQELTSTVSEKLLTQPLELPQF